MIMLSEKEAIILEAIYKENSIKQRELAEKSGFSLGITNAILKRLIEKGFLTVQKVNSRNLHYVVTSIGIDEILRRSYKYFKRTVKNVVFYRNFIEEIVEKAKKSGNNSVVLVGKSDLDFIIEYACGKSNIKYKNSENSLLFDDKCFIVYSEKFDPDISLKEERCCFIKKMIAE